MEVYRQYIFYLGTWGRISKKIINAINSLHPTIKFTAVWSKEKVDFLDAEVTI